MRECDIKMKFDKAYNGAKNFMTPYVERYGKTGNYLYELSTGKFMNDQLYGVTVLDLEGNKMNDLSRCCDSIDAAQNYINELRQL